MAGGHRVGKPSNAPPWADDTLLPRALLFSNPDHFRPRISPDGKRIAWLADDRGALAIWTASAEDLVKHDASKAKALPHDPAKRIDSYWWAFDNKHIVYTSDEGGDEDFHVHVVDPTSGKDTDLTPLPGVQARVELLSAKRPREVLVGLNERDKRYHDLVRVDLVTGKRTLVQKNEGFHSFFADDDFRVRVAVRPEKDGGISVMEPDGKGSFREHTRVQADDAMTFGLGGLDKEGKKLFLTDARGRDTAALVELDIATKTTRVLVDDGQADVREIVQHPITKKIQAAQAAYDRVRWHVVDPQIGRDLEIIQAHVQGDVALLSRSLDDGTWLVSSVTDGPLGYWLYDRAKKSVELLFTNRTALEGRPLARMKPRIIPSRDGLSLVSYLTLPREADANDDGLPDAGPVPMVLMVHGGPWYRDEYTFDRYHQWLASRGYAVLSVNFRGSTGFGKSFINAADKEWGGKMQDDLLDAVAWAVDARIADPSRVAIMGASYGGFATLTGLTRTPETFACGVDIVGPSNLVTMLESIPAYWDANTALFANRIGDVRTDEGKAFLTSRSPLTHVDRIRRPLLIGQGKNDPRVKQAESDRIVQAMRERGIPVTYALFPDEGHGFERPANNTAFNAVAEIFLAQCLGGRYEPIGKDFEGSSITVPAGKSEIHSLAEALP